MQAPRASGKSESLRMQQKKGNTPPNTSSSARQAIGASRLASGAAKYAQPRNLASTTFSMQGNPSISGPRPAQGYMCLLSGAGNRTGMRRRPQTPHCNSKGFFLQSFDGPRLLQNTVPEHAVQIRFKLYSLGLRRSRRCHAETSRPR